MPFMAQTTEGGGLSRMIPSRTETNFPYDTIRYRCSYSEFRNTSVAALDSEQLVEVFYMPLYRFALSLTREPCDAADLTQQTFLLWASKGHQLREQSKVKAWLFTSLYREFLRGERKRGRESGGEDLLPDVQCPPLAVNQLDGDAVVRALFDLEEIYRTPLSLFYLQEHSYKEIAEILELPLGTVMSRISRGKARLKKQLADGAQQSISEREIA
jgi:RNA polymerase sigma factor (sigma-70 family)